MAHKVLRQRRVLGGRCLEGGIAPSNAQITHRGSASRAGLSKGGGRSAFSTVMLLQGTGGNIQIPN